MTPRQIAKAAGRSAVLACAQAAPSAAPAGPQSMRSSSAMANAMRRHAAIALAASCAALWAAPALAVQPLQGRTITGAAVASTDPTAVMEYDPNLNLTWLRDWDEHGAMDWATAMNWAVNLKVGGFGGWSLPTIDPGDANCSISFDPGGGSPIQHKGYNCTGSPMGFMYYNELGNAAGVGISNAGPFKVGQSMMYFSSTLYAPDPVNGVWFFGTFDGGQGVGGTGNVFGTAAVRPGDVAAAVPEPQTWTLMLLGMSAVALARRRRLARNPEASGL